LVIGYTDFAISGRLPAILEQLHRRFPELSVDLVRMDSHKQISALTGQRLDLGFLTGPISYQDMKVLTVQEERFVVVFPEDHPLAALAEVPVAALANEPFVLGDPQFWRHFIPQIHALCAAAGFVPRVSVEGINSDGIFGLVAARMGVTIYPECVRNYRRTGLAIRPLQDVQTRLCTEVAWISSNPNPAIDQLISTIRELDSIRS
jgi:DNA-binding transcriptional LysR family regulator